MVNGEYKVERLLWLLLLSCITLLLNGCATHRVIKKDGPPNFHVDVSKIPNAVPKPEPLARIGNKPSYKVFGVRYYTLKSSRNYVATGLASWYGTKFHRRNTSSGEPYNMLTMTAAHKTLPLPTYVEVTNLRNHRKVIVKVNDRGPFVSNRLIDLSYVAAKKLGMIGRGTTRVKIRAIDPWTFGRRIQYAKNTRRYHRTHHILHKNTTNVPLYAKNSTGNSFTPNLYLQVGAFSNREHAEKLKKRLLAVLVTPIRITTPSGISSLYRVRVGPINDYATATSITKQLQNMGINANRVK